ncbi:TIGR02265 family protein [Archangium gephyra]|uniref:TIGR02265 family protein n=1 Tax=Archangium gephyra TaxID=48 RepID=UPI003B76C982
MEHRPQLLSRLSRCRPEQLVPGMFLEAALASVAARASAEVAERARREITQGERLVENYRYPVAWMLGILDIIGQDAETRGVTYGEAIYLTGRDAGLAYVRSAVGRMRALVASASGVHRTLEGIPSAASVAVNFGEHSYRRLSPSSGELDLQAGSDWPRLERGHGDRQHFRRSLDGPGRLEIRGRHDRRGCQQFPASDPLVVPGPFTQDRNWTPAGPGCLNVYSAPAIVYSESPVRASIPIAAARGAHARN